MRMLITHLLFGIALTISALFASTAYSNEATASDNYAEAVVVGKILQQHKQHANSNNTATATDEKSSNAVQPPTVENDLADGESIRNLPSLNTPIVDPANILTAAQKQHLSQIILQLYSEGKAQIGVIIVPTTGQEDIFGFAMRAAERWQLGSAKQDNGLLMAIAVNDRRIQILTGYGLEGVLPDIMTSQIINRSITPYFREGRYSDGIVSGVQAIQGVLNQDPEVAAQAAAALKERQQHALNEQQAREKTMMMTLMILIAGVLASYVVGRRLSASTAAVAGLVAGLLNGAGLIMSVLLAGGIFVLLISSIAQLIFQMFLSGGSSGGRGGGFGGGGYRGGGGGFGGGGASGSW